MAIIDGTPGVKVTVRVSGKTAIEYENPHEEKPRGRKTVTKYIESIDDAKFSVFVEAGKRYKWGHKRHLLRFTLTVDGQEIWRQVIGRKDAEPFFEIRGAAVCTGSELDWVQEELKFSGINRVNAGAKQVSSDLGVIQVTVTRVTKIGERHPMPQIKSTKNEKPWEVTEKLVKGRSVSHGTIVTTGNQISRPTSLPTFPILKDGGQIATFRFIYRSREALEHEMIIPRSNPPPWECLSIPDQLQDRSQEEMHPMMLQPLGREIKREVKTEFPIKREFPTKREFPIKSERSAWCGLDEGNENTDDESNSRHNKRARHSSTIDLTNDSD